MFLEHGLQEDSELSIAVGLGRGEEDVFLIFSWSHFPPPPLHPSTSHVLRVFPPVTIEIATYSPAVRTKAHFRLRLLEKTDKLPVVGILNADVRYNKLFDMTEITETTIRDVIVAAQVEATAVPLREYDEVTVHGLQEVIEVPAFGGFGDFELDLSCLSPPPSPPASVSEHSRSNSPRLSLSSSRSVSFSLRSESPTKEGSPKRQHERGGAAATHGSWPLGKYVGRGTPIDRNRRIEWGAAGLDEVGEDGVLFSDMRSTSLDSALRPSQRSASPEWNFLSGAPLNRRSSTLPPRRSNSRILASSPVIETPAIKIEGLGSENPEEWSSFMKTVLSSAGSALASTSKLEEAPSSEPAPAESQETEKPKQDFRRSPDAPAVPPMSPEEMEQMSNGLEMNLNINEALDLGLAVGDGETRMNYFNLGLLPEPDSGRESPSSAYSSPPPSPRASPLPSPTPSDNRSTTSTKAETGAGLEVKSMPRPWWRRILGRFRRIHSLIGSH